MNFSGITLSQYFTNTDLAELIGTSRETVYRMLSQLKKEGVVTFEAGGNIKITDLAYIKTVCSCEDCPLEICRI